MYIHRNDQHTDRRTGNDIADVYVGVHRERQRGPRGDGGREGKGVTLLPVSALMLMLMLMSMLMASMSFGASRDPRSRMDWPTGTYRVLVRN